VTYALAPDAVRRRALATAAMTTAAAIAPISMALVLFVELGAPVGWRAIVVAAAIVLGLGVMRVLVVRQRIARHLSALKVTLDEDALVVRTRSGTHSIARASIERVREIPGALGGLRLELADGWDGKEDSPASVDVPRGGEGFGELRAALERWQPIVAPKRAATGVRIALGGLVVLVLFFAPFFLDDVFGKSKPTAVGAVLAFWVVARIVLARR
jgi:MFS family permease